MAQFPANPKRLDPYKNFKFRLKWDGKYVYGGSKLTDVETIRFLEERLNTVNVAANPPTWKITTRPNES